MIRKFIDERFVIEVVRWPLNQLQLEKTETVKNRR